MFFLDKKKTVQMFFKKGNKKGNKRGKKKKKIALVLSGGGARGLSHIGVIEEFLVQGYEITSIVGTSMGALIGGVYALGKIDIFKEWFSSLTRLKVLSFLDISYGKPGLIKGEKVFNKMKMLGEDKKIEELQIPYKALATDLVSGKPYIFEKGSLYQAIRASVSIPTVLTPVFKGNMVLVDGGVLNNVPAQFAKKKTDELLVVVDLGARVPSQIQNYEQGKKESIYDSFMGSVKSKFLGKGKIKKEENNRGYSDVVKQGISIMMREISDIKLQEIDPDILISLSYYNATTFDFHKSDELIAVGRDFSKRAIAKYENLERKLIKN